MSITALPVLARILEDRANSPRPIPPGIASTLLLSAAANDFVAWSLLAITLALLPQHSAGAGTPSHLLLLVAFVAFMLFILRPLATRFLRSSRANPWLSLPAAVAIAFLSAHTTDLLGVHAFFGAFLTGICLPVATTSPTLDRSLRKLLRPIIRYTLPVFFALTGLRLQAGTLSRGSLPWLVLILALAVIGKVAGGFFSARATGIPWLASAQIGILSNARGLVELIVLNVGLRSGMLNPPLFTLFVLMALITTAMTVPLLDLVERHASPSTRS